MIFVKFHVYKMYNFSLVQQFLLIIIKQQFISYNPEQPEGKKCICYQETHKNILRRHKMHTMFLILFYKAEDKLCN